MELPFIPAHGRSSHSATLLPIAEASRDGFFPAWEGESRAFADSRSAAKPSSASGRICPAPHPFKGIAVVPPLGRDHQRGAVIRCDRRRAANGERLVCLGKGAESQLDREGIEAKNQSLREPS